jgi:shikimate dehydrogenase
MVSSKMAGVTGKTKVCALLGDPVEHTVSPAMHNAAFAALGLDFVYVSFQVSPENLAEAVAGLRALGVRGFNVTIPHKVTVIPLLDGLDPRAEKLGAVNTVVVEASGLRGFNTDAAGFMRALQEGGIEPEGRKTVVLGAGGASRAISYSLAEKGAELTILNRAEELDWAWEIAKLIEYDLWKHVPVAELREDLLAEALDGAGLLVNATSVGMSPDADVCPVPERLLRKDLVVFDVVYNPIETRLLKEARGAGARTISGVEMLVWQGALAFEMWTGQAAPVDVMRRAAVAALGAS